MDVSQGENLIKKSAMNDLMTDYLSRNSGLRNGVRHLPEDKHEKLTIGTFFKFMKTAYQVNDTLEDFPVLSNMNNEIDWDKLSNINLNPECYTENTAALVEFQVAQEQNLKTSHTTHTNAENNHFYQENVMSTSDIKSNEDNANVSKTVKTIEVDDMNQQIQNPKSMEELTNKDCTSVNVAESILTTVMKRNLSDVLHEGLLDSILPYMIPKQSLSQPNIRKLAMNVDAKKSSSAITTTQTQSKSNIGLTSGKEKEKEKDKSKQSKKLLDTEVEIHVCDEEKNIKRNFRCPQKLLIQKMCYFAEVTAGQKLEEIDISVHCDVTIFDWLMRWVKKDIIKKSEWPALEPGNVIPIMVSASFLQMEPLLENCLEYCHENMSEVLKTPTVLTCLDDNLLTSLADRFTNADVEGLRDKRDKIQSKLFCKLIMALAEPTVNNKRGHYSSLSTLFKCSKCGKKIILSVSNRVPCIANAMKIDCKGNIYSKHVRDLSWTLNDYILGLRAELRSWRKVYWRLWGDCHFLFCQQCNIYFPVHQMNWCSYHPELPQFFVNDQQRSIPYPLGRYPCCSQRAYRFEALPNLEGCRYKDHTPEVKSQQDASMLHIFTAYKEIISTEPPQLFFPEKITRLVARDPGLQPGKLICKDSMWWTGIEIAPSRQRLGLLGKIWVGIGNKRNSHFQDSQKLSQKLRRHMSTATDTSSPTSSITESDGNEESNIYNDSTGDEESHYSEESNAWVGKESKGKRKYMNHFLKKSNSRCWSGNLNVRHNQDNQRDFEEKAAVQMITLLTKRMSAASSLQTKSSHKQSGKKGHVIGGTYTKLESQFHEQILQSYKFKSPTGKTTFRLKSK